MRKMKNTMRYFSLAVLFVAVAALTGCEKEETAGNGVSGTYTASVKMADNGSKALTEGGVKTFAVDDQIAVIYVNTSGTTVKAVSEPLTAGDIAAGNKRANFKVTLTNPDNTKAITYIYPANMSASTTPYGVDYSKLAIQDGKLDSIAKKLDVCTYSAANWGGETLPAEVSLDNQLAICKFTVKESVGSTDITSTVTRLTVKNGSDIYTVNSSSLSTIWVAMKPVTTGNITVYAAKGKELYKKTVSSPTLDAGKLYPVNVTTTKIDGAVSGLFRVGNDLIYFSKGNLQATYDGSWSWAFAANQYDRIGAAAANTSIDGDGSISGTGIVDLFGWVGASNTTWTGAAQYGISNKTETGGIDNYGNKAGVDGETLKSDWGNTIGGGWRTPTNDEWSSIFSNHTYGMANIGGVKGIIILPYNTTVEGFNTNHDSYGNNNKNTEQWTALEAVGAVFLPAAGSRSGSTVTFNSSYPDGYYWSATPSSDNRNEALYMTMRQNSLTCGNNRSRSYGYSVRLIGE